MSQHSSADAVQVPEPPSGTVETGEDVGNQYHLSGSLEWSSLMSGQNVTEHQAQFSQDMAGQFANSKKPLDFLDKYFPPKGQRKTRPKTLEFPDEAIYSEEKWADVVNKSKLCPSLKFFCTKEANSGPPSNTPGGQKRRPDGTSFPKMTKKAEKALVESNFESLFSGGELLIERERKSQDAFRAKPDSTIGVEKHTETSELVRGQLISYAMHQHHQQPRVASYQLFLVDKLARIIRFDRAGVVCTDLFDWTKGTILADFLTRFNDADRATRGHDVTVTPATPDEVQAATQALTRAGYGSTHAIRAPFYKFSVPVTHINPALLQPGTAHSVVAAEGEGEGEQPLAMRDFIAGCPISWSPSFTGRATTGYICYDVAGKGVHFMKDAWRSDEAGLLAEYQVLALLGLELPDSEDNVKRAVPNVPRLLCGGDLRYADGTPQKTLMDVVDSKGNKKRVQEYTHFRMVVKEVGQPLPSFKSVPELLAVMRDVVLAHQGALQRKVLHRDISAGNVLIVRDAVGVAHGLLIDWDLCYVRGYAKVDETRCITGTWQFMSIALLECHKDHRHSEKDDLESVLWVLCYCLMRYTNLFDGPDKSLVGYMNTCFDAARPADIQQEGLPEAQEGGDGKRAALEKMTANDLRSKFIPERTHPAIQYLLSELAESLHHFLAYRRAQVALKLCGNVPHAEGEVGYKAYRKAERRLAYLEAVSEYTFPFTHENVARTIGAALVQFETHRTPSEDSITMPEHGAILLRDRIEAHQEAERQKKQAELEMQEKERGVVKDKKVKTKSHSGSLKRSHPSVNGSGDGKAGADADVAQSPRVRKSPRLAAKHITASSRPNSSRRGPPEPTVPEEDEEE